MNTIWIVVAEEARDYETRPRNILFRETEAEAQAVVLQLEREQHELVLAIAEWTRANPEPDYLSARRWMDQEASTLRRGYFDWYDRRRDTFTEHAMRLLDRHRSILFSETGKLYEYDYSVQQLFADPPRDA